MGKKRRNKEFLTGISVDTDAAAILQSATRAVEAILARRQALDRNGMKDKPLVILGGEFHNLPSNILHHMLVIKELRKHEPSLAMTDEMEHNALGSIFADKASVKVSRRIRNKVTKLDKSGALGLKSMLAWFNLQDSHHANMTFFNFLLKNNIPVAFTDAALRKGNLDRRDQSTDASIRACFDDAASKIDFTQREGLKVRNHHMAAKIAEYARKNQPRIIFHRCGNGHVSGDKADDCIGAETITTGLKNRGIPVFCLLKLTAAFTAAHIPPDHGITNEEVLVIKDLPQKQATYETYIRNPVRLYDVDFRCQAQEAEYLNAVMKKIGLGNDCLSVDDYKELREKLITKMEKKFAKWQAEYCAPPAPVTAYGIS